MALALMVSTRLWLAEWSVHSAISGSSPGETSAAVALCRLCCWRWMGFSAHLAAEAFRTPYKGGKGGRPRLYIWQEVAIVQVIKRRVSDTLTIERRIAQGCAGLVERLLHVSQHGGMINTAFIERLNATFRQRLAYLVRRGRALARQRQTLEAGMYLVGCVYNFCTDHHSLRLKLWITERRVHWVQRTRQSPPA
jgi:hypothetical protein